MRRLPLPRARLAALCLLAAGAGCAQSAGASHPGTGRIVFASDRGRADPGEIYSLGPGSAPRHVAPSPAAEYGLAVSPAGGRIAFWSGRTGGDELYLARADGSHVRLVRGAGREPLRADGAGGGRLTFTADGRRLFGSGAGGAFAVDAGTALARSLPLCERGTVSPAPDGKLVACADAGRTRVSDLAGRLRAGFRGERPLWSSRGWLTNAPGGGLAQPPPSASVLDASGRPVGVVHGYPVAWTGDGRYLLFRRGHSLRISAAAKLAGSRVLVARWDDGPVSLTPDGRYVSTQVRGRAVLIPIAGGKATAGVDGGSGVWSAGGRLAYAALQRQSPPRPGGRVPIYITDAHGRNPRVAGRLAWDYQTLMSLRWLPGGRRVLVTTENQCGGTGLFAISPSGGAVQPLNSDQRDLEMPASSPDGRRIAYSVELYNCHTESEAPLQLETVAADGSGARALTAPVSGEERTADVWPAFSPDGRRIAFLHAAGNGGALQTVSASGGRAHGGSPVR